MNKINWQGLLFLYQQVTGRVIGLIISALALLVNDYRYAAVPVIHRDAALRVGKITRRY